MSLTEVTVEGTLRPDGTVALDERPSLPPGRVTVVLRPAAPAPAAQEDFSAFLQRLRTEREAAGYPFMNEDEANAHVAWLREPDRIDDLLRAVDGRGGPKGS